MQENDPKRIIRSDDRRDFPGRGRLNSEKGARLALLHLQSARRIEMALQAERGCASEREHHGFAACCRKTLFCGLAENFRAKTIGKRQACLFWQHIMREVRRHGEIEPVAEFEIVLPFAVGLKIDKTRLDLDDPNIA